MNSKHWLDYFNRNREGRMEPDWRAPVLLSYAIRRPLAHSFSHFQLGESGEGKFLFAQARRTYPEDPGYAAALELFVAEEQEHARLLRLLVERFGGSLISRHWTHSLFRGIRRALGVDFEIQVLVIAEIVGTAYYRLVEEGCDDSAVHAACALILRDEAQHLAFHAERFASSHAAWLPLEHAAWAAQFQAMLLLATSVAWWDHQCALREFGVDRSRFFRESRLECIKFLGALQPSFIRRDSVQTAAGHLARSSR